MTGAKIFTAAVQSVPLGSAQFMCLQRVLYRIYEYIYEIYRKNLIFRLSRAFVVIVVNSGNENHVCLLQIRRNQLDTRCMVCVFALLQRYSHCQQPNHLVPRLNSRQYTHNNRNYRRRSSLVLQRYIRYYRLYTDSTRLITSLNRYITDIYIYRFDDHYVCGRGRLLKMDSRDRPGIFSNSPLGRFRLAILSTGTTLVYAENVYGHGELHAQLNSAKRRNVCVVEKLY